MEEIERLRKENEELRQKLEMIEMFYGEDNIIERMKKRLYMKYIKEKGKNANNTNNRKNDTTRNNTIFNNSYDNSRNNEIDSLFNNKEMKKLIKITSD